MLRNLNPVTYIIPECTHRNSLYIFSNYVYMHLQANIFVLAWSREGQMLVPAEKVILPLLTAYMFLLIILGAVAVSLQSQFYTNCHCGYSCIPTYFNVKSIIALYLDLSIFL